MKRSYADKSSMQIPTQLRKGPHKEAACGKNSRHIEQMHCAEIRTPSEEKKDYYACMLRKAERTLLRL